MGPDSPPSVTLADGPGLTPAGAVRGSTPQAADSTGRDVPATLFPSPPMMTVAAFAIVAVPFTVIVIRLLLQSGRGVYLPDDLALIDLHTREALQWHQQLGVFDRFGWNHPGPSYFYLLALAYRVLGSGPRALFVGAALVNALAAVACVAVVRRRTTPARALWAALWLSVLGALLAAVGPGSITYSEGALGGLVSPWNPMVIIFPLVLLVLLGAAAVDRSPLSLVAALVVGSFVVQTNISALPLVAALLLVAGVWSLTPFLSRSHLAKPGNADLGAPGDGAIETGADATAAEGGRRPHRWGAWGWVAGALVVLVAMWAPPVIQQVTGQPGNLGLIYQFFTAGHPGQSVATGLWSVAAVFAVVVEGPSEVMGSLLGNAPHHQGAAVMVSVAVLLLGAGLLAVGLRQGRRFAAGIGALTLFGFLSLVFAVTRITGFVYGYLVVWAVAVPVATLIGIGMVRGPLSSRSGTRRPLTSTAAARLGLCAVGVVACVAFAVRVVQIPSLDSVSDPQVGQLLSLVRPALAPGGPVLVGDNGAGTGAGAIGLLDTERFIGLVNQLDQRGYDPRVNPFWQVQFGPGYVSTGHQPRQVQLYTWTPSSSDMTGYVGRVGNMAVTVTDAEGRPVVRQAPGAAASP